MEIVAEILMEILMEILNTHRHWEIRLSIRGAEPFAERRYPLLEDTLFSAGVSGFTRF